MLTHVDQVLAHEQQHPDDVWLTQPMGDGTVRTLTWREAIGEARRVAAHLREVLPRPSQVAIFAKNNAWWVVTDLAIAMAGHVSVPIYPTLTAASIRQILDHSETKLIVIGKLDGFDAMEPGIPPGLPRIAMPLGPATGTPWADIIARTAPLAPDEARRAPDDLATIIYTSGSTGVPKGAMHSFRTMAAATAFAERLNVSGDDRFLSYLPLAHAYERAVVETVSFKTGAQLYFTERLETFVDDLRRARPTVFVSVPRLWTRFQQAVFEKLPPAKLAALLADPAMREPVRMQVLAGLGLASVRYAGTGSAPMPAELLGWYRELGLELLEGYAMTENFCVSHATRIGEVKLGYCGRPQDGVEQRLTADGEVLVKSPGTMLGYFKAPDLTAAMIDRDGFLHTGDRGEVDELGRLKITGRVKELFKTSKGKYVAPAPIENALLVHDDVEQALVSGAGMPQPFGMIVLSDAARARAQREADRAALAESLAAHLEHTNARLDPHERLDRVVVVRESWTIENDMLTPTMKVRRDVIERHYADRVAAWYEAAHRVVWA